MQSSLVPAQVLKDINQKALHLGLLSCCCCAVPGVFQATGAASRGPLVSSLMHQTSKLGGQLVSAALFQTHSSISSCSAGPHHILQRQDGCSQKHWLIGTNPCQLCMQNEDFNCSVTWAVLFSNSGIFGDSCNPQIIYLEETPWDIVGHFWEKELKDCAVNLLQVCVVFHASSWFMAFKSF